MTATAPPDTADAATSAALRSASRRYVLACVLFWLPVGLSVSGILLFADRGHGLAAIAALFAVHSLTAAALELPTGGLSDVLGRRPVLAASGLLNVAALTLLALGTNYAVLVVGMVLKGTARALSSGPAEAWYVDTVQAHAGPGGELRSGLSRGSAATSAALAVGTLSGGAAPWLLDLVPGLAGRLETATGGLVLPLSVPVLLGAAVTAIYVLYVLSALREPPRAPATLGGILRGVPATISGGLRLGVREVTVRRILLTAAAGGVALSAIELLTPNRAALITGSPESGAALYAVLACAGFAASALGSSLAPLAARIVRGGERAVLVSLGTGAAGLLLLAVTARSTGPLSLALAAAGYVLLYLGIGAAGPNQNELLHRRVTSAGRTTALSVQSLALQLSFALAGPVLGALRVGPLPWLIGGVALAAGSLLWTRRPAAPAPAKDTAPAERAEAPLL
ncbi:MFS transporter [Streptomyces sp. NPDC004111]|uniref:MFS transporter n=1 Tax=Streptomyces sp. NPDC004111 TaxID=3364690 RepID=UPI003690F06A